MKTTPEQLAELKALAEDIAKDAFYTGTFSQTFAAGALDLIADLEEADAKILGLQTSWETSIKVAREGADTLDKMAEELAATRKQLEEAQAKLAAAEKDAVRWNKCQSMPKQWWIAAMEEAGLKGGKSLNQSIDAAIAAQEGK